MKRFIIAAAAFLMGSVMLTSCGSEHRGKTPIDDIIKSLDAKDDFTIMLYDMEETGFLSKTYKHQYKVVQNDAAGMPKDSVSDWVEVPERYFLLHESDMGMEIASKTDGKLHKEVAPPGYSNYVGNSRYGEWRTDSHGHSFWAFYGQYMFLSSMFHMMGGPVYRTGYTDYRRNYRGVRPYYGTTTSGSPRYGTYSKSMANSKRSYTSSSAFRNKVNSRVSPSASPTAGSRSTTPTGRSDSRYGSGSSFRSRSSSGGGK